MLASTLSKHKWTIVFFLIVIGLVIGIYIYGRKSVKNKAPQPLKFDASENVPTGWSAQTATKQLYDELTSWWTNDTTVVDIFKQLSGPQLKAVYNEYANTYSRNLKDDVIDGVSGSEEDYCVARLNEILAY